MAAPSPSEISSVTSTPNNSPQSQPLPFAHSIDLRDPTNPQYTQAPEAWRHSLFGSTTCGKFAPEPSVDEQENIVSILKDAPRAGGPWLFVLSDGRTISCKSTGAEPNDDKQAITDDFAANHDLGNYIQGLYAAFSSAISASFFYYVRHFENVARRYSLDFVDIQQSARTLKEENTPILLHIGNSYFYQNIATIQQGKIGTLPSFAGAQIFELVESKRQNNTSYQRVLALSCDNAGLFELISALLVNTDAVVLKSILNLQAYLKAILPFTNKWESQIATKNFLKLFDDKTNQSQLTIAYNILDLRAGMAACNYLSTNDEFSAKYFLEQYFSSEATVLYQEVKTIRQTLHNLFFANPADNATQQLVLSALKILIHRLPNIMTISEDEQQLISNLMTKSALLQAIGDTKYAILLLKRDIGPEQQTEYNNLLKLLANLTLVIQNTPLNALSTLKIEHLLSSVKQIIYEFQPAQNIMSLLLLPTREKQLYSALQTKYNELYSSMIQIMQDHAAPPKLREKLLQKQQHVEKPQETTPPDYDCPECWYRS